MAGILSVAPNPSLDESTQVARLLPDQKLSCSAPTVEPGGGGINVARAARELGGPCTVLWAKAGPGGEQMARMLDEQEVPNIGIPVRGDMRHDLTVLEEATRMQYRFVMPGPTLDAADGQRLLDGLAAAAHGASLVVLSGSLPPGLPVDFYAQATGRLDRGARVLLDTKGDALRTALQAGVFLVKPNLRELSSLVGKELQGDDAVASAAQGIVDAGGARAVVVSLGAAGALLVTGNQRLRLPAPPVAISSRVGAGDSMMAGIAVALLRGQDLPAAVRFGVAAGTAAIMTPATALCRRADAERLFAQMPA